MARHSRLPVLKLSIWKKDGTLYYCEPDELRAVIAQEAIPEADVRGRMGYGYSILEELLQGKRVDIWALNLVEHGIMKHKEVFVPPPGYEMGVKKETPS